MRLVLIAEIVEQALPLTHEELCLLCKELAVLKATAKAAGSQETSHENR